MSKAEFMRLSGWAFILAAFSFITILSSSDALAIPGSAISSILLAGGMFGLWRRYGERVGGLGRSVLVLGVSGPVLFGLIIAAMALIASTSNLTDAQVSGDGLWIVIFAGPVIPLLCLTLFGLSALSGKQMARLSWLPIFTGIWYPVVYFILAAYLFTHHGRFPQQYLPALQVIFLAQFIALFVLGAVLASDRPKEVATT